MINYYLLSWMTNSRCWQMRNLWCTSMSRTSLERSDLIRTSLHPNIDWQYRYFLYIYPRRCERCCSDKRTIKSWAALKAEKIRKRKTKAITRKEPRFSDNGPGPDSRTKRLLLSSGNYALIPFSLLQGCRGAAGQTPVWFTCVLFIL